MSTRETSPLPWTANIYRDEGEITDANGFTVARYRQVLPGCEEGLHANDVRLIVRAVNSHAALLATLENIIFNLSAPWVSVDQANWNRDMVLRLARSTLAAATGQADADPATTGGTDAR